MTRRLASLLLVLALLLPLTVVPAQAATQSEIDLAIQKGLAWLATTQNMTSGAFGSGYTLANTASSVMAMQNEGHFPGGGTLYSANVEKGYEHIFQYARYYGISAQAHGNPDSNGNGTGVYFRQSSLMYESGMILATLIGSNTPNRLVTTGPCTGLTYAQVAQEMVDYFAFAQVDSGPGRGGWYYTPYSGYGPADNSVAQWPVLGMAMAESWGIYAPGFVKPELSILIDWVQNDVSGGSGYSGPNDYVNVAKTGGLLTEMFYVGDEQTSARAQQAVGFLNTHWNRLPSGWYGNKGHPYAMFATFKGLELMDVATIPNAPANDETSAGDWWGDYCENLVNTQNANGSWNGYHAWGPYLATPWYIVILQASVFPVSVDVVVPDNACDDTGYDVQVHYAVERFPASGVLTVYKNDVLYDSVNLVDFQGSETLNYTIPTDDVGSSTWRAVLMVTGGGINAVAEDSDTSEVFDTPQVSGIPDQASPFVSFDLDDYQTCACGDVDWSVTGAPVTWTVTIDANSVVTVTAPAEETVARELTFVGTFHWPGIDCVDSDSAVFSFNRPPHAHPGKLYPDEKYHVVEGGTVQLDGTQSSDPDGDPLTYAWDFDNDTVFGETGLGATNGDEDGATPFFSAAYLDNPQTDEVHIYLRVCDPSGECNDAHAEVEIEDAAPTAAFSWSPDPQDEYLPLQFTDTSTSPVDDIVGWEWDFGDGVTSTLQHPDHTYWADGVYDVCLTVEDDDGSVDTVCQRVAINNVVPDLEVTLLAGPEPFCPTWNLHYQFQIENIGDIPLERLYITDVLPSGVCCPLDRADTEIPLSYDEPSRQLTWFEESLEPGETTLIGFTVHSFSSIPPGQRISNTMTYRGGKMLEEKAETAGLTARSEACGSGAGGLPTVTPTATVQPSPTPTATPEGRAVICIPMIIQP